MPEVDERLTAAPFEDLAPMIYRQRLVIEGRCRREIGPQEIADYLSQLSDVCGMIRLIEPVTHQSPRFGWAGWVHWETSGAHLYAWDYPIKFFSVDIYTCAPFDADAAYRFTKTFFAADEAVARPF